MSITDLVSNLKQLDIRLSAEGDCLRVNAPRGTLTESLRAQIATRKEELLDYLRDNSAAPGLNLPAIVRRKDSDPTPLSFAQERIWFLEQLEPGSAVYNICRAWRLLGKLNFSAIESCLNEVVRRHEILRSSIRIASGQPVQGAQPPFELKLSVIDLQTASPDGRESEIRERIQQAADAPFDFAAGKFLRAELLRVADDEHVLILATHHIVSDAWSMGILTRELWSLYETYTAGKSAQLEELQIQYGDFAAWQREWLQGEVLERQVSYWKDQLKDLTHLNLPTDRSRPAWQSFKVGRIPIGLPKILTTAIHELSNQVGVTPFMILLAAFQVLLYRYCEQEDIVVGSPIANRARTELEPLVGFFVNTLVLRSDLSGHPAFKELLARVREVCLGAYAHQDLPFEKLVQELQAERDPSRNPLFQVMFALQNATRPFTGGPSLRIETIEREKTLSQFDLSLFLRERDSKYIGYFEYSTELFNSDRIERMATHYLSLLEAIVADPNQSIATVPILTKAERHKILVEWNDTTADYPKDKCIHELFEDQAERTPEAIALQFEEKRLTYRELNRRANQLAHYLQGLGIGPEKLVGICVDRSLEMMVGLLGILKAGGAYVPLDPAYPRERLEFMLQDAQVSVLLPQEKMLEDGRWRPVLTETEGMDDIGFRSPVPSPQFVCLDRDWDKIAEQSEENPENGATAQNLAYVIYTSGSTGTPKGVAIEHRNIVNLLHWAKAVYRPSELVGVLASTSICFDLSVFEIFLPLSCGGKVIVVQNALCLDGMLERSNVTLINTVPSVMVELLKAGVLPKSVRTVNLAGEPLRAELVKEIYNVGHIEKVYDLYGPSETTTYSTFTLRTPDGPNTIGRPISNTQVYILDSQLQPVTIGVYGEIYIGGDGVARGYLNRPQLTSERFVPHPFSNDRANRLYRTGDRARYRPDGNIEFLGRTDNQVKVRGYRIEPREIEATLNQHPMVKEAVVVARDEAIEEESRAENPKAKTCTERSRSIKNPTLLVAYIVSDEDQLKISDLRDFLKQKLPEYMIPSSFVILEALPLMPNGKVDRSMLPVPAGTRLPLKGEIVSPRTEIEELIAQTWREVLKIENVGIYDNFFELGGHSLLSTQIVARLQEAFNKDVPVRVLFDAPTIADLAQELETIIRDGRAPELPPIVPVPRDGPIPLSMNQQHLWHLDRMMSGAHFFNMPYVYRLSGDLNIKALQKALKEIVRRHEALRTVFAKVDGRPVQIIKDGQDFQVPVADLRINGPDDLSRQAADLILQERERPFNLSGGQLLRTKLVRLTDTEHLLLITMHHIISDHWSMLVFRRELLTLYEVFARGRPSPLPLTRIHFADYAWWEKRLLENDMLEKQLAYWEKQLVNSVSRVEFRSRRRRTKGASVWSSQESFELNGSVLMAVKTASCKENCTPFMYLVAALNILLYSVTGQNEIRIGTLLANRCWAGTDAMIGHLTNTVILKTRVLPNMTVKKLLQQVREVVLGADAHQQLPFEHLAQVLEQKKYIKRESLFQVLVMYHNSKIDLPTAAGLRFAPFNINDSLPGFELPITPYDMVFKVREASTKLTGTVNYRRGHYGRRLMGRLPETLKDLLAAMRSSAVLGGSVKNCISRFNINSRR